ncbi:MAG TPA: protease pro-enzyme activation domain-containing protein [Bryobacteraceae bacterium]|nr:protease pro-enzyme activation domain-containing protein [Bryobacteraceae bacterium]
MTIWNFLRSGFVARSALLTALALVAGAANAQPSRISKTVDGTDRFILRGSVHPKARPENDQGRVTPSLPMSYVTLMLTPSESQKADLAQLLRDQQDPNSPNYHHWLTPEEYADRFGVGVDDLNKITSWLEGQGLTIASVARGRNWVAVNGDASRIESAFQTEIHEYLTNGEKHFAAAVEPSVPAAFSGVILKIRGLNDFRMKPKRIRRNPDAHSTLSPHYTASDGENFLTPDDVANIYDIAPLYTAGFNGKGQWLVVVGQTRVNVSDIQHYRSSYGLPANDPQSILVANSPDPGIQSSDLDEADLDLELSGAVARNATILYVYSTDVIESVQYAIDQNLAPVISQSYGSCEPETPSSDALAFQQMAEQANAQGITWLAASGDSGAADCDDSQNPGLSVDLPGSVPEVTSLGGTEFAEGSGQYWRASNASSGESVISYIPETTWNDSTQDGQPSSGGGGASIYFPKPTWQTGTGVPADNARDVPDVSLSASADHDGYFVYTGGQLKVYGGTSVAAPSFAGIVALLNQYLVSSGAQSKPGVGNINPKLYSLARSTPSAFHDVTIGTNIVTVSCGRRSVGCSATAVGYSAGKGYDQATGLGSVDAYRLVTAWKSGTSSAVPTEASITLMSNLKTVAVTDSIFLTASVMGDSGITPTGTVHFSVGGVSLGTAALVGSGGTATATLTVSGNQLPAGSGTITAAYSQGSASSVTASVTVSVSGTGASNQTPVVQGVANGASFQHVYSPGMTLSVFGSHLAPSPSIASSVPLPFSTVGVAATVNNVAAPLYYVSPGQLNIQIPYETAVNQPATLRINNNGLIGTYQLNIVPASPGIFTDSSGGIVPVASGNRGSIVSLYLTGAGAVSPEVATGAAPNANTPVEDLPKPSLDVAVTVGGVTAPIQFIGIPTGLVGVMQINFYVPIGVQDGTQPVVVTVNGQASSAANLKVNN